MVHIMKLTTQLEYMVIYVEDTFKKIKTREECFDTLQKAIANGSFEPIDKFNLCSSMKEAISKAYDAGLGTNVAVAVEFFKSEKGSSITLTKYDCIMKGWFDTKEPFQEFNGSFKSQLTFSVELTEDKKKKLIPSKIENSPEKTFNFE